MNLERPAQTSGSHQFWTIDPRIVEDIPEVGERLVQTEEVFEPGGVTASNCVFGYVMTTRSYSPGHALHGKIGARRPDVEAIR